MTREQLCQHLALPCDAAVPAIRARAARIASGKIEFGSSPAMRGRLISALRLPPGCSDIAIIRVCESILRPHPLSRWDGRRNLHTGVVDARDVRIL